jgi:hypothetical protein
MMKHHRLYATQWGAVAALLCAVAPGAVAFEEIENGSLVLATTASATYDTNIEGRTDGPADFIYSLYPDLLYTENQSQLKVDAGTGVTIDRYEKYSRYNANDVDGHLNMSVAESEGLPFSGVFDSAYTETDDVDYYLAERVRAKAITSMLNGLYPLTQHLGVGINGLFDRTDRGVYGTQKTEGGGAALNYSDFLHLANLSLQYNRLEAVASSVDGAPDIDQTSNSYMIVLSRPIYDTIKASATYGYRYLDRSPDETDNGETRADGAFYSLNLDGPFLPPTMFPKLKSSLLVAYERATTPGINDEGDNRLVAAARLAWEATDTTSVSFRAAHEQDLASNNLTVVSSTGTAEVTQRVGHFILATLGGGYERDQFLGAGRTDDIATAYASVEYRATRSFVLGASYRLHDTASNDYVADFGRSVVRLYATYTY